MLISVVVPIYKVEEYINNCLDSIINQTYRDIEIILVDDGSPDKCPQICEQYAQLDERIKVIHKKNDGLVSAWSTGVHCAKGEYIAFIDSDDWISERYIEIMANSLKETSAELVSCLAKKVWSNKQIHINALVPAGYYDKKRMEEEIYPILLNAGGFEERGIPLSRWAKIISKKLLLDNMKYCDKRVTFSEDVNIVFPVVLDASSVYIVDDDGCMYYYRYNPKSMLNAYDRNMLYSICHVHPTLLQICDDKNYPEIKKQVYADFLAASVQYYKNELQNPEGLKKTSENIRNFSQREMVKQSIRMTKWNHYRKLNVVIIHCMKNFNWWGATPIMLILRLLKRIKMRII